MNGRYQSPSPDAEGSTRILQEYWEQLREPGEKPLDGWLEKHGQAVKGECEVLRLLYGSRETLRSGGGLTPKGSPFGGHPSVALKDGTTLGNGKLRVLSLLDSGGMGEVYVAWHKVLACDVAVKVLPERLSADPAMVERFQKGIAAQARIGGHENIVPILDADDEDGRLYLVMAYVDGNDLGSYLRSNGRQHWPRACEFIRQAGTGLAHAHRHDIVHRDIKPSNLIVSRDGEETIKILDWGLARLLAGDPQTSATLAASLSGNTVGTPDYVAPEQARDASNADHRSDLYSLGCTFYQILAGHPPFAHHKNLVEKLDAHLHETPPPLTQFCPDLPAPVVSIVERLMEKSPAARYQSADELLAALAALVDSTSDANCRRTIHPGAVWLVAAALTVVVAVGTWRMFFSPDSQSTLRGPVPERSPDTTSEAALPRKAEAAVVESLKLRHLLGRSTDYQGDFGVTSFAARFGDSVQIDVQLDRPAHCFLIAYNPDGSTQLCSPGDDLTPPDPVDHIKFPADPNSGFRLTDGTGVQAFALVASTEPLPSYVDWSRELGTPSWESSIGAGVWCFDGTFFERADQTRGEIERLIERPADMSEPFYTVCRQIKERALVDAIRAVAFPVFAMEDDNKQN